MKTGKNWFGIICAIVGLFSISIAAGCAPPTKTAAPAATKSFVSISKQVFVNIDNAYLRTGPGIGFDKFVGLQKGQKINVIGESLDGEWYLVELEKKENSDLWILKEWTSTEAVAITSTSDLQPVPTVRPTTTAVHATPLPSDTATLVIPFTPLPMPTGTVAPLPTWTMTATLFIPFTPSPTPSQTRVR